MEHWIAGILATPRASSRCCCAPNINSYKRFVAGQVRPDRRWPGASTTAPARCAWSASGPALRVENRVPGGDVNPYLAISAIIAGGLHGIENELPLPSRVRGQRVRRPARPPCPPPCARRRELFSDIAVAREAFGDEVVDHYLNQARIELEAYDAAVTDWERIRGFERL